MPTTNKFNETHNSVLRSESVNEILSRKPTFLQQWALLIFLFVFLFFIGGTWFVSYPDIVQASANLAAVDAPKEIVVRQDGKIVKLFLKNDDNVFQGQTIAWIESTANHKEIISLDTLLKKGYHLLTLNKAEEVSALFKNDYQQLGELQYSYQQFITGLEQFNDYLVNGYYYKRKRILFEDLAYLKKMHKSIELQKELIKQDLQLAQESFDANNSLFMDKVISKQELRDQRSKLYSKQISIPQFESALLSNENLQISKQKEIDELEHNITQQKAIFLQSIQTFISLVSEWERKYIIKAATSGRIVFLFPIQENQFLQIGKIIGFVNPFISKFYAEVTLPQNNFGKITIGQKVQLRFDAYPFEEFGVVEGKLQYISKVPSDSGYLCNVELPNGLVTNYNRQLQFSNGLKSKAFVITKDLRLAERFYNLIFKMGQGY